MDKNSDFEIIKHIATLPRKEGAWATEIKLRSWYGKEPMYDIRDWLPDHHEAGEGLMFTADEAKTISAAICKELRGSEHDNHADCKKELSRQNGHGSEITAEISEKEKSRRILGKRKLPGYSAMRATGAKEDGLIRHRGFYALDGTPAVHTPCESSYYYDRFAIFNNGWQSSDSVVDSWEVIRHPCYGTYSLRLFHNESQWFNQREPRLIWVLLSMILGHPVTLTGIEAENKNRGGYPTWYFYYKDPLEEMVNPMKAMFYDILLERDQTYQEDMKKREEFKKILDSI